MKQLLTTEQIAQHLQVSPRTLATWRADGLPHISITARSFRYDPDKVEDWLRTRDVNDEIVLMDGPYPPVVNPTYTSGAGATFALDFENLDGDYGDYLMMDICHKYGIEYDLWPRSLVDLYHRIDCGSDPSLWTDGERANYRDHIEMLKYLPKKLWLVNGGFVKLRERVLAVVVTYLTGRVNAAPDKMQQALNDWAAREICEDGFYRDHLDWCADPICSTPREMVNETLTVLGTKRAGPELFRRLQAGEPVHGDGFGDLRHRVFEGVYEGVSQYEAEDGGNAFRQEMRDDELSRQQLQKFEASTKGIESINIDKLMAEDLAKKKAV
jgi:hypothetical protein